MIKCKDSEAGMGMALKDSSARVEQEWAVLPHQITVRSLEDHFVFCLSRESKDIICIFKKPLWVHMETRF